MHRLLRRWLNALHSESLDEVPHAFPCPGDDLLARDLRLRVVVVREDVDAENWDVFLDGA
jgi:hypothetical protein